MAAAPARSASPARPSTALLLVMLASVLVPAAAADSGKVNDPVDDGGLDQLDIQTLWIDVNDTQNLTFRLQLGAELQDVPATSACHDAAGCSFLSLTYRVIFRVLDHAGQPLPSLEGYNRSYVAYRHGPNGTLVSPVGAYTAGDNLVLNGSAAVSIDGRNLTLRIPRANPAVNMALGATPGAVVDQVYAYDSPQLCSVECAPLAKPGVDPEGAPTGVVTSAAQWDRAPDAGYANATVFPAPPVPAQPAPTGSASPTPAPAVAPAPQPAPPPSPAPDEPLDDATATLSTTNTGVPRDAKESPGLAASLLVGVLASLAFAARRRL